MLKSLWNIKRLLPRGLNQIKRYHPTPKNPQIEVAKNLLYIQNFKRLPTGFNQIKRYHASPNNPQVAEVRKILDVRNFKLNELKVTADPAYITVKGRQEVPVADGCCVREFEKKIKLPPLSRVENIRTTLSPKGILKIQIPIDYCSDGRFVERIVPIEPEKEQDTTNVRKDDGKCAGGKTVMRASMANTNLNMESVRDEPTNKKDKLTIHDSMRGKQTLMREKYSDFMSKAVNSTKSLMFGKSYAHRKKTNSAEGISKTVNFTKSLIFGKSYAHRKRNNTAEVKKDGTYGDNQDPQKSDLAEPTILHEDAQNTQKLTQSNIQFDGSNDTKYSQKYTENKTFQSESPVDPKKYMYDKADTESDADKETFRECKPILNTTVERKKLKNKHDLPNDRSNKQSDKSLEVDSTLQSTEHLEKYETKKKKPGFFVRLLMGDPDEYKKSAFKQEQYATQYDTTRKEINVTAQNPVKITKDGLNINININTYGKPEPRCEIVRNETSPNVGKNSVLPSVEDKPKYAKYGQNTVDNKPSNTHVDITRSEISATEQNIISKDDDQDYRPPLQREYANHGHYTVEYKTPPLCTPKYGHKSPPLCQSNDELYTADNKNPSLIESTHLQHRAYDNSTSLNDTVNYDRTIQTNDTHKVLDEKTTSRGKTAEWEVDNQDLEDYESYMNKTKTVEYKKSIVNSFFKS